MVGHATDNNAANDQGYFKQIVDFRRKVTSDIAGDKDGDGRVSLAEWVHAQRMTSSASTSPPWSPSCCSWRLNSRRWGLRILA